MLKKLMLSVVACSMIFIFGSHDASARVKGCCPCQTVKVHKVRCRPHHHACCPAPVAACGHAAATPQLAPIAEHGPMPSTAAPVEAAPSPSAADVAK